MTDRVLTTLGAGDLVWVAASEANKDKVFVKAAVLALDEAMATVRTTDAEQRIVQIDYEKDSIMLVNPVTSSDMCGLHHIHEPGILENLQERSYSDQPYTAMGSVMVAVNPLKSIADPPNMIGSPAAATAGIPHPYQMAEVAYQQMAFAGSREVKAAGGDIMMVDKTLSGQSIVISGESGAGKTESAKMCLAHLVRRGGTAGGVLDARLLGTNPILEAFGNATTLRNPNSSRFGKLLKLLFVASDRLGREYKLDGAAVETYLLERSRITFHGWGERNYHVFYMMMYGPPADFVKSLGIEQGPKGFAYMCPTKDNQKQTSGWDMTTQQINGDKRNYAEMDSALDQVGFSSEEKGDVWKVLAGVLHMGNWVFEDPADAKDGEARVTAATMPSVEMAAKLFGVDAHAFVKVFTERHVAAPGGTIIAKRNAKAAGYARDAVAKSAYSKLFDWLVVKMNEALRGPEAPHPRNPQIGVLDIFGFESFAVNGFEQLLINFTNEALQATFNRQVFVAEAQLYEKEGLFGAGDMIGKPQDNSITLDLLQGPGPDQKDDPKTNPKGGLLMIIDSEGMNLDANDTKFNQKLHGTYSKNPAFLKPHPKDMQTTFIVKHYAGAVIYTVGTFLEKNNDSLPGEVDDLMSKSSSGAVRALFPPPVKEEAPAAGKKGPPKKPPAKSIVRKFQQQIKDLVNNLEATRCSFIRCVKPTPTMKRGGPNDREWFDRLYTQKQLICLNIPQTAEVLRNGFPTRIHFSVLVDSYKLSLPKDALLFFKRGGETDHVSFVKALFHAFEIGTDQYKLGLTRVFFRSGQLATLDKVLRAGEEGVSAEVAKRFKSFYIRNIWKRSIAKVRAQNKFTALYEYFRRREAAVIRIQSAIRTIKPKKLLKRWKKGTRMAQKHWRGKMGRKKFYIMREALIKAQRAREEAERQAKLAAIQAAKDEQEKKRLQAEMERFQKEQDEARRQEELRRKHAEEEEEKKIKELEAAMKHAEEEAKKKEQAEKAKRRQSMMPTAAVRKQVGFAMEGIGEEDEDDVFGGGGKGRATKMANGKVQITRKVHKIRQKSIAPHMKREAARKDRMKDLKNKIHGTSEQKNAEEMLSTMEREQFRVPIFGFMTVRSAKKSFLFGYKWSKLYFMLSKPDRVLKAYADQDRSKEKATYQLSANTKILEGDDAKHKKTYTYEIQDSAFGSAVFSCDAKPEKERWMKDLRETITGFVPTSRVIKKAGLSMDEEDEDGVPPPPDDDDDEENEDSKMYREMYSAQIRNEKIAQLKRLLAQKIISQREFDETCAKISQALDAPKEEKKKAGGGDAYEVDIQVACPKCGTVNNTSGHHTKCIKCKNDLGVKKIAARNDRGLTMSLRGASDGNAYLSFGQGGAQQNAQPLKSPLCNTAYHKGVFSCELSGSERGMDFSTFEEFVMYVVQCRYKLPDGSIIGWSVARRFKQWRQFAWQLEGTSEIISPFDDSTRKKLPVFPRKGRWDNLRGVKSAGVVQERDNQLKDWLTNLLKLAPDAGKGEIDKNNDDNDNDEEKAAPIEDVWECIRDEDTGEEYWWNKETEQASWERPRADSEPPPVPPKPPLLPGWEAIRDPVSGEVYYWHSATQTTTWERPMPPGVGRIFDGSQLLHIPAVNKFFELKKFVGAITRKMAEEERSKKKR